MIRTPLVLVVIAAMAIASCASNPGAAKDTSASGADLPHGGTLRIAVESDTSPPGFLSPNGLDPKDAYPSADALLRCCLLRRLYSYRGVPTAQGGLDLQPDLAAGPADVSSDGLSWTIHLRPGVHYGPPFRDRTVTSADIIRGIQRTLGPPPTELDLSVLNVIKGVQEFETGATSTIAGLEAPDDLTLVIRLLAPEGDLDSTVLALGAFTAPLPPGVADGHEDDFSQFLVSTGPYMLEGSEQLDFSLPPAQQKPLDSFVANQHLTLVRNPAWDPANDPLRPALVDRMEFEASGTADEAVATVDRGDADLYLPGDASPSLPAGIAARYEADPSLRSRFFVNESSDIPRALEMNLAVPPFDDVHVRKAVNLILDKQALADLSGGAPQIAIAHHLLPSSLENGLLSDYDPYATPGSRGDRAAAMAEMRLSRYDHDGDGLCDDPVCTGPMAAGRDILNHPELSDLLASNIAQLGIQLNVLRVGHKEALDDFSDPRQHLAVFFDIIWTGIGSDGLFLFAAALTHPADGNSDFSLVGASAEQLAGWGYTQTAVPTIDDAVQNCQAQVGHARVSCAATVDQQLMQTVVPWAPYQVGASVAIVSARVVHYSFDQIDSTPAFDQIALG